MAKKRVEQLDFETDEVIETYESIAEAADDNFLHATDLVHVLKHQNGCMKRLKLKFRYKEE